MKRFIVYTGLAASVATVVWAVGIRQLYLVWDAQPNIDVYYIYSSGSVTNPLLTSSNTIAWNPFAATATNFFPITPAQSQQFYIVTASNIAGESFPAGPVLVPQVATNPANVKVSLQHP